MYQCFTLCLSNNNLTTADLRDPKDRVVDLSELVASLPITNYSLLRALIAHLINIVQNNHVNKMNIRNMGIVFSPTLQIPAGIFSLMLSDFKQVFNVDAAESESDTTSNTDAESSVAELNPSESKGGGRPQQERVNKRNSMLYAHASADQMLGLEGRQLEGEYYLYLLVLSHINNDPFQLRKNQMKEKRSRFKITRAILISRTRTFARLPAPDHRLSRMDNSIKDNRHRHRYGLNRLKENTSITETIRLS